MGGQVGRAGGAGQAGQVGQVEIQHMPSSDDSHLVDDVVGGWVGGCSPKSFGEVLFECACMWVGGACVHVGVHVGVCVERVCMWVGGAWVHVWVGGACVHMGVHVGVHVGGWVDLPIGSAWKSVRTRVAPSAAPVPMKRGTASVVPSRRRSNGARPNRRASGAVRPRSVSSSGWRRNTISVPSFCGPPASIAAATCAIVPTASGTSAPLLASV